MRIAVNGALAVRALGRHKFRTALTMLGIVIGVAAVIAVVALGTGARTSVAEEMRSAGATLIVVRAGNYTRGGESVNIASGLGRATTLTRADGAAIAGEIAGVNHQAASVFEREYVTAGETRWFGRIDGVGEEIGAVYGWRARRGRLLNAADVSGAAAIAVLGETAAAGLFGAANAVGRDIEFLGTRFEVVGVTDGWVEDQAETVFVPVTTLQRVLGVRHVDRITIAAERAGETSRIAAAVVALLRARHGLDDPAAAVRPTAIGRAAGGLPDDFTVKTQAGEALAMGLYTSAAAFVLANLPDLDAVTREEMELALARASDTMTALLVSIATVSLVVGGIGIMNVMLVSVTERTAEIGMRLAVGARRRDVLWQFLLEAVGISLSGGALGVGLGLLAASFVERTLAWPTDVSAGAIGLAVGLAVAVGISFGLYPARKASRLDPIDALRYE